MRPSVSSLLSELPRGVILASMAGGFNVDLFSYLFGNILAIKQCRINALRRTVGHCSAADPGYYHDIFSITFDEELAKVSGSAREKSTP